MIHVIYNKTHSSTIPTRSLDVLKVNVISQVGSNISEEQLIGIANRTLEEADRDRLGLTICSQSTGSHIHIIHISSFTKTAFLTLSCKS